MAPSIALAAVLQLLSEVLLGRQFFDLTHVHEFRHHSGPHADLHVLLEGGHAGQDFVAKRKNGTFHLIVSSALGQALPTRLRASCRMGWANGGAWEMYASTRGSVFIARKLARSAAAVAISVLIFEKGLFRAPARSSIRHVHACRVRTSPAHPFARRPRTRPSCAGAAAEVRITALAYWLVIGGLVYQFIRQHDESAPPPEAETALASLTPVPPPAVREWWRLSPAPVTPPHSPSIIASPEATEATEATEASAAPLSEAEPTTPPPTTPTSAEPPPQVMAPSRHPTPTAALLQPRPPSRSHSHLRSRKRARARARSPSPLFPCRHLSPP